LNAGRTEEAIAIAESLLKPAPEVAADAPPEAETRDFLALCYLRLGEQENCIAHHGIESCLLPIRGGGVHTAQRGSRAAIREFTTLLGNEPGNLSWRWLLNIAYMTVGEYPGKVPKGRLVPPRVFESEHDITRFVDVAPRAGLSVSSHAGGAIMEDFDGDGILDIMASSMGVRDPLRLFRSNGDGTFTERSKEAGLAGEVGGLNIVHADYDNDGDPDVLVLRGGWMRSGGKFPNSLLRNNGDGTFDDVTEEAGILSFHPTQTGTFGDYDNDGWLDLFIGNESLPEDPHPSELYRNNGDGTFTDRSADLGDTRFGYVKGVVWGDFNNDGRQDLWVAALGGASHLFRNDGPAPGGAGGRDGSKGPAWRFTDVTRAAGILGPKDAFPSWFWDYDNDGWLDLLAGGYRVTDPADFTRLYLGQPVQSELPRLHRNNRDGTFGDVTRNARLDRVLLPMGSNFGDLDNDGFPDCYFGTGQPSLNGLVPNRMFRNDGGKVFQ
ncbi:MAG: FG-GAP repeat domain-containing protein, partial [Actinomycetota bacterium]